MHEIITLQFGQQANYLGTHYWNTQESYFTYNDQEESLIDHDRSFRQGVGADGSDTYTPRALIYDLKGAFGTLRRENELYQLQHQPDPIQQNAWGRDALTLRLPPIAESLYQQALSAGTQLPQLTSDSVRFWSDYNHVYHHPRGLIQLNEYELNSSLMPFERFDTGEDLFSSIDREHDVLDRDLRPLLEACDQLQGIQIFSSTTDAWGGFASRYLERIADELGKGSRWLFAIEDNHAAPRQTTMIRLANTAKTIASTSGNISLHVPLQAIASGLPSYLSPDQRSLWHSSAIHSAIVETLTIPTRVKETELSWANFYDIEAVLNTDGRRPLAAASMRFSELSQPEPQQATQDHRMLNGLSHEDMPRSDVALEIDLFPAGGPSRESSRLYAMYTVSRVNPKDDGEKDEMPNEREIRMLEHHSGVPFPMLRSFPQILDLPTHDDKIGSEAIMTTSEKVARRVRYLAHLTRSVLPVDEREALYDSLSILAEEYEESMGFDDLSSGDDD